jgi:ATP-dependent DNA helicase RecG
LKIRGPGELLGARQSGLPILRYADLIEDEALVEVAAKIAAYALKENATWVDICLSRWVGWKSVLAHA